MRYINICLQNKLEPWKFQISTNTPLKGDLIYMLYSDKLVLSVSGMDYRGTTFKFTNTNYEWYQCTVCLSDGRQIELGKFLIDEDESNEDEIVIYFEDKID